LGDDPVLPVLTEKPKLGKVLKKLSALLEGAP
jgi:hypothetical protein